MGETDHSIAVTMYKFVTWQSQKKFSLLCFFHLDRSYLQHLWVKYLAKE